MAGGTGKPAPDDLLTCERCHGFYAVEVPPDGSEPRVRCKACGHVREVSIAPVQEKSAGGSGGKWTVIGPDGKVMTFPSWEKLVESRHPSATTAIATPSGSASKLPAAAPEEKRPSASALLDVTPTPALPKLELAELDSDPNLLAAAPKPSPEDLAKSFAKSTYKAPEKTKGPEWAPIKSKVPSPAPAEDKPPQSIRELDSGALVEDAGEEEPAPLSLRDAIVDEDGEPAPLSLRDAIVEDARDESAHEMVSLRDLQVVPPGADSAVDSTPPPPPRGVLRTLPPTGRKDRVTAPPPTITVEDPPPSRRREAKATQDVEPPKSEREPTDDAAAKKTSASKGDSKRGDRAAAKRSSAAKTTGPATSRDEREPVASAKPPVPDEEPKRGWVLPAVAVAGVAIVLWRMMAASPETPPPPSPTAATSPPPTTAAPTESSAETDPAPVTTVTDPAPVSVDTSAAPMPAATATATATAATTTAAATAEKKAPAATTRTDAPELTERKPAPAAAESGMSMSDLLDRAGSARRSGDYATARELYERVLKMNPGNVEANGGLGDVARAQGDLTAAKASYERALAASPAYGPAQLGLADTEWDLGNRAGAQRRYAQIVERLGDRAPERAKQRSSAAE